MKQPSLFDDEDDGGPREAHARRTDPETSHAAAASLGDLRKSQDAVLDLFRRYGAMHDELLVERARLEGVPQTVSGLRTRRRELVDRGLLAYTGRKTRTISGNSTRIWGEAPLRNDLESHAP